MKQHTQLFTLGWLLFALTTPASAHTGSVLTAVPANFSSEAQHLLTLIAAGLAVAVLPWYRRGRSARGTRFRDWLTRGRR